MLTNMSLMRCATLFAAVFCFGTANGQNVTVVNDNFSDGITNNGPQQIGFNTNGLTTNALDLSQPGGPLDFASGDSARSIHGLFDPQTLANFGDSLEVVFDFTTPDTIAFDNGGPSLNEDFRFGLFNTAPAVEAYGVNAGFNTTIFASFNFPNQLLAVIPGFIGELNNINAPGSDIGILTHNINSLPQFLPPTGQLLLAGSGFDFISSGQANITTLIPNSEFRGKLLVEFTDATLTTFDITAEITDAAGSFLDSHTATVSIGDIVAAPSQAGVNTNTFDLLVFSATTGAFGGTDGPLPGSSTVGEPNNGIDISNVEITFTSPNTNPQKGDVDGDGDVDFSDIPPFIAALQSGTFLAEADADCSGTVDFADIPFFIAILQSQ